MDLILKWITRLNDVLRLLVPPHRRKTSSELSDASTETPMKTQEKHGGEKVGKKNSQLW